MRGTEILLSLLGSVALLMWGVRMVRTGMTRAFGSALRRMLATYARNRASAFGLGLGVTTILQSSTATGLLLASFSARGVLALPLALAAMLGADIGTAIASQIFSFDVKWLWTVMVAAGVIVFMSSQTDKAHGIGRIVLGLGMMLLALVHIGLAARPLAESEIFVSVLSGLAGDPILGFVFAVLATWLAHSSLSMVLLVMSLCAAGALPLPLSIALVLGANVGGAIAPLTALSGSGPAAKRVALANLGMRSLLAVVGMFLIAPSVRWMSLIDAEPARLVVNFHLAFNLCVALLFLPWVERVAALAQRMLPDAPQPLDPRQPRYLDPNVMDVASEALACAMRETLNLGDQVAEMLRQALVVLEKSDSKLLRQVERADDAVDALHEAIKLYLVKVSAEGLTDEESRRYAEILTFTANLEHIGDIIDKNLMELATKKIKHRYEFSREGFADICKLHARVMDSMRLALNVFATRDVALARRLLSEKTAMRNAELAAAESHYARLRQARAESIETSSIHLDVIRDLKRIHSHLTSVAYPILEPTGELQDSRLRAGDLDAARGQVAASSHS
jgi:phosphate:Na+ symporter